MTERVPFLSPFAAAEALDVADVEPSGRPGPESTPSGTPKRTAPPPPTSSVRIVDRDRMFRALYEAEVGFVWRNLRRLGIYESDVDDKTQEVFVIAHRRFGDFEDRGFGARAWLFQIVLRVASDARRHRRRHPEDADGGVAVGRHSVDPQQTAALLRREQLNTLDRALQTIEIGRRAVLVLHEIEELTAPEIARALGLSVNTVYSRLRVARAELDLALSADGEKAGER